MSKYFYFFLHIHHLSKCKIIWFIWLIFLHDNVNIYRFLLLYKYSKSIFSLHVVNAIRNSFSDLWLESTIFSFIWYFPHRITQNRTMQYINSKSLIYFQKKLHLRISDCGWISMYIVHPKRLFRIIKIFCHNTNKETRKIVEMKRTKRSQSVEKTFLLLLCLFSFQSFVVVACTNTKRWMNIEVGVLTSGLSELRHNLMNFNISAKLITAPT